MKPVTRSDNEIGNMASVGIEKCVGEGNEEGTDDVAEEAHRERWCRGMKVELRSSLLEKTPEKGHCNKEGDA